MIRAYYATTDVGPFRAFQVALFEEGEGWAATGHFRLVGEPLARPGRGAAVARRRRVETDAAGHLLIPVVL